MPPSSSGLGYQVLILKTGVRVPLGVWQTRFSGSWARKAGFSFGDRERPANRCRLTADRRRLMAMPGTGASSAGRLLGHVGVGLDLGPQLVGRTPGGVAVSLRMAGWS